MAAWQNEPFEIAVKKGDKIAFCLCGGSANGPYCDGTHKGTGFQPAVVTFDRDRKIFACGCQQSAKRPYCDGTHNKL